MFRALAELVLASGSPRRRELLAGLGLDFSVVVPAIDEGERPGEAAADYVLRMARSKGETVASRRPSCWVVAADTVVVLDGRLLPKPDSVEQAVATLLLLSGREHQVRTGFSLCCREAGVSVVEAVLTRVRFRDFSEDWARAYACTGEPMDKAGAYGIQGRGGVLVERLEGSYSNVVGLPLAEVVGLLCRHGVATPVAAPAGR